jgi:hypothetical protein
LQEEPEAEVLPQGFEDDPMGFILKKYPGLNTVMEYMMTKDFREFVDAIFVVAPKPTTFKVLLHNGQYFFLQFMGKAYQATVLGKNYYLMSIGEKERCMLAIARLLRYGPPLKTKGPESGEEGTRPEGDTGGGETGGETGAEVPPAETSGEEGGETLEERKVLAEILKKSLFEKEVKKFSSRDAAELTKNTVEKILKNKKSKRYGLTPMGKKNRIGNLGKITADQFIELIKDTFGANTQVSVYKPKEGPNIGRKGSSKFKMFQFSPSPENPPVNIILAGGKNEGEKFEADLFNSMKESAGKGIDEITNPLVKSIFSQINIDPKELQPEDIVSTGKNNTNRSLDWKGPTDVGRKIADVIIKGKIYLSIKDKNGGTFYNGGNIPFIVEEKNGEIRYDEKKRSEKPDLDKLFTYLGVDPNKIVEGLKKYTGSKETKGEYSSLMKKPAEKKEGEEYLEEFKKFIASGYGYGYWYVRKKKGNTMFVKELKNQQDAMDMVGNISEVQIKYPGPSTKSTVIKVVTDDESMINTDYLIEFRNDRGGVLPLSVKMKSTD